ncbi:MAG: decaprenyl-phosphate phosphoribosyltransferase [Deltaproteobacteria bacterium]|jgi:4-hydroxybenzoate polyprenyltransferase|nr:decaprenyl-phosphate phosphoribosyltransferase [Deltaproteobacteria bacterium]
MNPLALIRALRPHQWVKNGFVLAAVVFQLAEAKEALSLTDGVRGSLLAVVAFCLGASAIYLVNDVLDVEHDRKHPEKSKRPIAAGEVSIPVALIASVLCAAGAVAIALQAGDLGAAGEGSTSAVAICLGVYVGLNVAYSLRLKHVVLLDAFCIATGFLLRVKAGGFAAGALVSPWLLLCTFFLALFLALCKRRAECDLLGEAKAEHRKILGDYEVGYLDQMVTALAACTILCYSLYTVIEAREDAELFWTVPFVVFGLGRYMWLVQQQQGGGSPTRVLLGGDPMFVINTLGWMVTTGWLLFSEV